VPDRYDDGGVSGATLERPSLKRLLADIRAKDGTFWREDFSYDHERDVYLCPGGKTLTTTGTRVNDGATLLYRASKIDCDACALKPRCCPKEAARKVPRSIHEGARDMARAIAAQYTPIHPRTFSSQKTSNRA
jgi:hypothetical protein